MSNTPHLSRFEADALARKITDALVALGRQPSRVYLEAKEVGLLITATFDGITVATVLPPDFNATYEGIATTLLQEARMAIALPATPRPIWAD